MLKLFLRKKNDGLEEMQLSKYCSIAGHENLCCVEDLGWSVDHAGYVW